MERLYPFALALIFVGAALVILAFGINVAVALVGAGLATAGGILASATGEGE